MWLSVATYRMRKLGRDADRGREAMVALVNGPIKHRRMQESVRPVEQRVVDGQHEDQLPHEGGERRQRADHHHSLVLEQVVEEVDDEPLRNEVPDEQRLQGLLDQWPARLVLAWQSVLFEPSERASERERLSQCVRERARLIEQGGWNAGYPVCGGDVVGVPHSIDDVEEQVDRDEGHLVCEERDDHEQQPLRVWP